MHPFPLGSFIRPAMVDAMAATVYGSLTGGQFLAGLLTCLGASGLPLALALSLTHLSAALQPLAAPLVQRGDRKWVCIAGCAGARACWLLVAAVTLWLEPSPAVTAVSAVLALGNLMAAYSANAWLTWISELVSPQERAEFFAKRNMLVSATTLVTVMAGGWYVDWHGGPGAFRHVFLLAVLFGAVSCWALLLQPRTPVGSAAASPASTYDYLMLPLRDPAFSPLLLFKMSWSFVVGIAAPLWVPHMLTILGMSQLQISYYNLTCLFGTILFSAAFARLASRIGNKPALVMTACGITLNPLFWCLSTRGYLSPCWFEGFWSGTMWAGFNLFILNLAIELAPAASRPIYMAVFAASEGIAFFLGGLGGGLLAEATAGFSWHGGFVHLGPYHPVLLLSSVGRLLTLALLVPIVDPKAIGLGEALAYLRSRQEEEPAPQKQAA